MEEYGPVVRIVHGPFAVRFGAGKLFAFFLGVAVRPRDECVESMTSGVLKWSGKSRQYAK